MWFNKMGGLEITSCLMKDATIHFLKEIDFLYVRLTSKALGESNTFLFENCPSLFSDCSQCVVWIAALNYKGS